MSTKKDARIDWRVTKQEKTFLIKQLDAFRKGKINSKGDEQSEAFEMKAWDDAGNLMDIERFCEYHNLPIDDIKKYKLVSHTGSPYYNVEFRPVEMQFDGVDFEEIIEEAVKRNVVPRKLCATLSGDSQTVDRAIISDIHVGLDTNPDGNSLYGGKWDMDELMHRADVFIQAVLDNQTSETLYIDDLGDLVDGWNGKTTRESGHTLPQNLNNKGQFDVAFDFKVKIVEALCRNFAYIKFNNVCEDNHGGDFTYVVNSSFKRFAEAVYPNVEVENHTKFMSHYRVGQHCIILSHGKDSKHLKFGMKPQLDAKQVEKIDQYIKANNLYNYSRWIEFSKGDSHQCILDMSTSDDFDYMNYPAFSPSSGWCQTNFKKGRSGFILQTIDVNKRDKVIKPYWFEWKK